MNLFHKNFVKAVAEILSILFIFISFSIYHSENDRFYYSLKDSGEDFLKEGNFQEAIHLFRRALVFSREIDRGDQEINCYMKLGLLYWNIGHLAESTKCYKRAFLIAKRLKLVTKVEKCQGYIKIFSLYNRGKEHRSSGENEESIRNFQEAIYVAKKIESQEHEVKCLRQLSAAYWRLNDLQQFVRLNEEALKIAQKLNHKKEEARCLINIGVYYDKKFNYSKALNCYHKALKITQNLFSNEIEESVLLNNIGAIYIDLGYYEKALDYLKKSLNIDRQLENNISISKDLINIGSLYRKKGHDSGNKKDLDKSLDYYFECLKIAENIQDVKTEIQVLNNIGNFFIDKKDYDRALRYFLLSFEKAKGIKYLEAMGMILNNIGIIYFYRKNYEKATASFNRAIEIAVNLEASYILWEACFWLGKCYEANNQLNKSIDCYKRAIDIIEYVRGQILFDDYKTGFVRDKLKIYRNLIGLLYRFHIDKGSDKFIKEIFHIVERAKARAFLESLKESKIYIRELLNPILKSRERELSKEISSIIMNLSQVDLSQNKRRQLILRQKKTEDEYIELISKIRNQIPEMTKLISPKSCRIEEIQEQLLDNKTALIEYFLGEKRSLMFLVMRNKKILFTLPPRGSIEKSIRAYLKILSQPPSGKFEGFLASKRIYKEVLLNFLEEIPNSVVNLIIVPDGILYYLPFETLQITNRNGSLDNKYLIEEFRVSYAPSSSSLLFLIKEKYCTNTSKGLLAFANPFYHLKSFSENNDGNVYIEMLKELYSDKGFDLSPLPYSQKEVKDISKYFPDNKKNIYLKKDAKEDVIKNISLMEYRVIHFACHGILDASFPHRSALVLALDEDIEEDGFLQVREIYNLNMKADLIVLSACQTGKGKLEKWEGIMGLPRIFFYAGAKSVVSTLWKIRDKSTANFMQYFYKFLYQGQTKTQAIQLAKIKMINSRYSHPFYWGAFVLHGDYSSKLSFN